jgi:osmoprotectant transport system substrate-binding protein
VLSLCATACGDDDGAVSTTTVVENRAEGVVHEFIALDAGGPVTKEALASDEIDVAVLFTSSADETVNNWVHLDDDRGLQPVENFIPALRSDALSDDIAATIDAVSAKLTTDVVQPMVALVGDGGSTADIAADFLAGAGLPGALNTEPTGAAPIKVGSASFPESELAGEIYTQALLGAGLPAEHAPNLGFREVYLPALESGDIDLVPEFVGSLLTHLGGEPTNDLDSTVAVLSTAAGERGLTLLAPAPAQSQNGFYVTAATADELALVTVSDLAGVDRSLTFGGPPECPERPLCLAGLVEVYGLDFNV